MFDGVTEHYLENLDILVNGETIEEVGVNLKVPESTTILEASKR